jgi:hypothetical protein
MMCNMHRATCYMQHGTCSMELATCNVELAAQTSSVQHETCSFVCVSACLLRLNVWMQRASASECNARAVAVQPLQCCQRHSGIRRTALSALRAWCTQVLCSTDRTSSSFFLAAAASSSPCFLFAAAAACAIPNHGRMYLYACDGQRRCA